MTQTAYAALVVTLINDTYNVTVHRLYKDGDDWKQTASFGREDLPLVAKVVDMAHTWTYEQAG